MLLTCSQVDKWYGTKQVLHQINLTVAAGEVSVLLGPSGCGKTTLLRIIAGLTPPDNGRIFLNDQDITHRPVHQRSLGMVFQDYALFPHKNVNQNVAFGLRMRQWPKSEIDERVAQVLGLVGLADFGPRPIHELSGGEQQRVALARSLAPAPRLILLDEPLGALDRALRERLMLELRQILKSAGSLLGRPEGMTAVYVTHDQSEAFAIADKLVVMNNGRIEQVGLPQAVYRRPATPFVARFLGMANVFDARLLTASPPTLAIGAWQLEIDPLSINNFPLSVNHFYRVLIRPEAARLVTSGTEAAAMNCTSGRLIAHSFRGRYQQVTVQTAHEPPITLKLELETAVSLPSVGDPMVFSLDPAGIIIFPVKEANDS